MLGDGALGPGERRRLGRRDWVTLIWPGGEETLVRAEYRVVRDGDGGRGVCDL